MIKNSYSFYSGKFKWKLLGLEMMMLAVAAVFLIPVYYLLVTTFKSPAEAVAHPLSLPKTITLEHYHHVFESMNYWGALKNNLIITVCAVTGIVLLGAMAAYSFARKEGRVYSFLFVFFLVGMMVPYQMGILALYRIVVNMGLMNTLIGVILILLCYNLPLSIFLFRGFISSTVPRELEEAAWMDGCGVLKTFFLIVLPLLKPIVATVAILTALNTWNDFMTPLLFLQSRENSVLLLELFRNIGQFSVDWTNFFPMMFLSILPLLLFYLFMQRFIIEGITSGSIKG
ncbi:carbohydrate ABC transporter permease [Paenibacillus sp. GCM10023252]|uniref:carbohydrate ABC transporter permease n=1 Tax=Paenibacillus sp. GCM10023252 TaxID=3252649 RepID=UPI0036157A09